MRLHARVEAWTDAIALYRDSLAATPNSAKLQYNLDAAYERDSDFEQADDARRRTLTLQPTTPKRLLGLAI